MGHGWAENARRRAIAGAAALAVALALCVPQAGAQTQVPQPDQQIFSRVAAEWQGMLDRLALSVTTPSMTEAEARYFRGELARIRDLAMDFRIRNDEQVQSVRALLRALGPPPAAGAPAESANIAAERKQLTEQLGTLEGRSRQAELAARRADTLLSDLAAAQRAALAEKLFEEGPVPLLPSVLRQAVTETAQGFSKARTDLGQWLDAARADKHWNGRLFAAAVALVSGLALAWALRRWLLAAIGRRTAAEEPSFAHRANVAIANALSTVLMPFMGLLFPLWVLLAPGLADGYARAGTVTAINRIAAVLVIAAIIQACISARDRAWRLYPVDDKQAKSIVRRIRFLVGLMVLVIAATSMRRSLGIGPAASSVFSFVLSTGMALLVLSLVQPRLWFAVPGSTAAGAAQEPALAQRLPSPRWLRMRLAVTAVVLFVPAASLAGYSMLAVFLARALTLTALIFAVFLGGRAYLRDSTAMLVDGRAGAWTRRTLAMSEKQASMAGVWTQILGEAALALIAVVALLSVWGIGLDYLVLWLRWALSGIAIGSYTLAPVNLLAALAVFVALLLVTRMSQRFLGWRVLPHTALDQGAQDSIRIGIGYAGGIVAILAALSALGVGLDNLALVAGALGVGIGFGLQTIVNNFLSGLILLAERPIKVGDVVTIDNRTGRVLAIRARATEILTAQGQSVIVPNSLIVSQPVVNLTHTDSTTRVDVTVGAAYDSDPRKVSELLLAIARAHKRVLADPEPIVVFANFGASALEFELRAYVAELGHVVPVGNELRFAIHEEFRANGIEIAYNRLDVALVGGAPDGAKKPTKA